MASSLSEPLPRWGHYSAAVGGQLYVWGGSTKGFTKGKMELPVYSFNQCLETWQTRQPTGNHPPNLYSGACTSLGRCLYLYGGSDRSRLHDSLYQLDTDSLEWTQFPSGPMKKRECGMISYEDKLILFGGFGFPLDSTQPGSEFIKDSRGSSGVGWTNEQHMFDVQKGEWSSPTVTGTRPPPCSEFSFTKVDYHCAALFGGFTATREVCNHVYILDLKKMHWSVLNNDKEPWPVGRTRHAAVCLWNGGNNPQLLVTGGVNRSCKVLSDAWILDFQVGRWREADVSGLQARCYHSATAISICPGVMQVTLFGGCPEWPSNLKTVADLTQIANTIVLKFEYQELKSGGTPPTGEWILTDMAESSSLGTRQRIEEKVARMVQALPTSSATPKPDHADNGTGRDISIREAERRMQKAEERCREAEGRVREVMEERDRRVGAAEGRAAEGERRQRDAEGRAAEEERRRREAEGKAAEEERRRREAEGRAAEEERRRREAEGRAAEEERRRREAEGRTAEEERRRREVEGRAAEEERRRREAEGKAAEEERRRREAEGKAAEEERRRREAEGKAAEEERRRREAEGKAAEEERRRREVEGRATEARREKAVGDESLRECEEKLQRLETQWVVDRREIQLTGPELGRGSWATVSIATFRGVHVAAKYIHNHIISPHNMQLFKREMNMAARIRHPNLLQFIGATPEGEMIILTELMPTRLRTELRKGYFNAVTATSIGVDVARALNYLHLMQPHPLIHRDISSANVLLQPLPNSCWRAKVSDYGTVNLLQSLETVCPGNPEYAAPEANDPTKQSTKMDIFSFGVLLMEMLTGEFPDSGNRARQLHKIFHQPLLALVQRCLSQDRDNRPSASDIITELNS